MTRYEKIIFHVFGYTGLSKPLRHRLEDWVYYFLDIPCIIIYLITFGVLSPAWGFDLRCAAMLKRIKARKAKRKALSAGYDK
jgi:hypothetical protein